MEPPNPPGESSAHFHPLFACFFPAIAQELKGGEGRVLCSLRLSPDLTAKDESTVSPVINASSFFSCLARVVLKVGNPEVA